MDEYVFKSDRHKSKLFYFILRMKIGEEEGCLTIIRAFEIEK